MVNTVPDIADSMNIYYHSLCNHIHCVSAYETGTQEIRVSLIHMSHIYILRVQPERCTEYQSNKNKNIQSQYNRTGGKFFLSWKQLELGFIQRTTQLLWNISPRQNSPRYWSQELTDEIELPWNASVHHFSLSAWGDSAGERERVGETQRISCW